MTNELGSNLEGSELTKPSIDGLSKTKSLDKMFEAKRDVKNPGLENVGKGLDNDQSVNSELMSGRELTNDEKDTLRSDYPGRSENTIDNTRMDENGNEFLKTRNSELEGKEVFDADGNSAGHYEMQTIEDGDGHTLSGVFLNFDDPKASVTLPFVKEHSANSVQFNECNHQLAQQLEKNPEMTKFFTTKQLDAIKNSDYQHPTIPGLVWHHQPESCHMILVDSVAHNNAHTGGNAIWGGGTDGAY